MKKATLLILCFALVTNVFAQEKVKKKALKSYKSFSYVKTTEQLINLAENGEATIDELIYLGNSFYNNGKMEEASKWYDVVTKANDTSDVEVYFKHALSLKAIKDYENSNKIMRKFCDLRPNDKRCLLFNSQPYYISDIRSIGEKYELTNLEINSAYSDFGASLYKDNLVFASSRDLEDPIYSWNEQPFLDIFQVNKNNEVLELSGDVNTKYHESSTSFSKDGKTMFFTRNNFYDGKLKKDKANIHKLKIYKATLEDNNWKVVESLPFNSDEYNVAHPALSPDESKLYFASDMPGTVGSSDIFVVNINADGTYGEPTNLGPKINTPSRENFPFIDETGTLYFSSDGLLGLGGLDIFMFEGVETIATSNQEATNLGEPINSPQDDFNFVTTVNGEFGYLSSNREGGKGDDDIYKFNKIQCKINLVGTVIDAQTKLKIQNADAIISYSEVDKTHKFLTNEKGQLQKELDCGPERITITVNKAGYLEAEKTIELSAESQEEISFEIPLQIEPKPAEIGTDLFKLLGLNPIYFDYDKSFIRPDAEIELNKIIDYMNKFPTVKIDVRSHTDSRGRDAYNFALSNRRNASTKNYIIEKGSISEDRLVGKGYGETQLVNNCSNGVKCSKEQHQANRRSEFIIIAN